MPSLEQRHAAILRASDPERQARDLHDLLTGDYAKLGERLRSDYALAVHRLAMRLAEEAAEQRKARAERIRNHARRERELAKLAGLQIKPAGGAAAQALGVTRAEAARLLARAARLQSQTPESPGDAARPT
jgi:hypothetical protein